MVFPRLFQEALALRVGVGLCLVEQGFPLLFVDGTDLAAAAAVPLPEIGNEGNLSFGALMSSEGTEPFMVAFDAIALYELA